jgi:hypothetical protein
MATGGIKVHVYGDYDDKQINKAIKDLEALKTQGQGTGAGMSNLTKGMLAVGAAAAVMAIKIGVDAVSAAMEDEKSMVALAKAMENVGLAAQTAGVEDFISKMSVMVGIADDELRPAFQRLVSATGDVAKSQQLLGLAADISAAGYGDLVAVSKALSSAAMGNFSALSRLKVPIDANIIKSKDLAGAIDALNSTFGGQAQAAAATYGGSLKRVQIALGEVQEAFGFGLMQGFIGDAGDAASKTDELTARLVAMQASATNLGETIGGVASFILMAFEVVRVNIIVLVNETLNYIDLMSRAGINLADALGAISDEEADLQRQALDAAFAAREQAKYTDILSGSTGQAADAAAALAGATVPLTADQQALADQAAETAAQMDAATAAIQKYLGAISLSQSVADFDKMMAALGVTLDGNKRSFKGHSDAAMENANTLRKALADDANNALAWKDQVGASSDQLTARMKSGRKAIIDDFVAQGFKRQDIIAFLGAEGIWTGPMKDALDAAERAGLAKAYAAGKAVGADLSRGLAAGVLASSPKVQAMTRQLIREAEAAARAEAESDSPSKVFQRIGDDLVGGLIIGMSSKKDKVAAAATEMMQGIAAKAGEMVSEWDTNLSTLKGNLDSATSAVTSWATSTSSSLASAFDISGVFASSLDENGQVVVSKWQAGVDAAFAQFQWYTNVLGAIKASGGSDALISYLMSQGIVQGGAQGQGMIDNGLIPYFNSKLAAVQAIATTTADAMVPAFMSAGVAQAQANYEGFKANYGEGGPARAALENLMDRLARSLDRTSTITVKTVYEAAGIAGKRALGGPVSAAMAYVVGERGPEVFVPSGAGNIIPNGDLPTAGGTFSSAAARSGGTTYAITVQAGVGDPRAIGQQVVEYIRKFESANGNVFAAA